MLKCSSREEAGEVDFREFTERQHLTAQQTTAEPSHFQTKKKKSIHLNELLEWHERLLKKKCSQSYAQKAVNN